MKIIKTKKNFEIIVDDEDFEKLNKFTWFTVKKGTNYYARRSEYFQPYNGKNFHVYIHRQILDVTKGKVVDHINGNTLDNRKCNLRICNQLNNTQNSTIKRKNNKSGFKGVFFCKNKKSKKKYKVNIQVNKVQLNLGYYLTAKEAAIIYDKAALKYFGEFARTNFPKENYA